jgi:hypothetical protein
LQIIAHRKHQPQAEAHGQKEISWSSKQDQWHDTSPVSVIVRLWYIPSVLDMGSRRAYHDIRYISLVPWCWKDIVFGHLSLLLEKKEKRKNEKKEQRYGSSSISAQCTQETNDAWNRDENLMRTVSMGNCLANCGHLR